MMLGWPLECHAWLWWMLIWVAVIVSFDAYFDCVVMNCIFACRLFWNCVLWNCCFVNCVFICCLITSAANIGSAFTDCVLMNCIFACHLFWNCVLWNCCFVNCVFNCRLFMNQEVFSVCLFNWALCCFMLNNCVTIECICGFCLMTWKWRRTWSRNKVEIVGRYVETLTTDNIHPNAN